MENDRVLLCALLFSCRYLDCQLIPRQSSVELMIPRRRHHHHCLPMREKELKTRFNAISVPIRVVNLDRPIQNRKEDGDGAAVVLDNFNEWDGLTSLTRWCVVGGGCRRPSQHVQCLRLRPETKAVGCGLVWDGLATSVRGGGERRLGHPVPRR